jgi:hypothetical protein
MIVFGGGGGGLMLLFLGAFLLLLDPRLLVLLLPVALVVLLVRGVMRGAAQLSRPQQGYGGQQLGYGRQSGRRPADPNELAAVRRAIDEDVTVFGEELQRLGNDMAGTPLDEGTRADYQRALDDYEAAKESAEAVNHPEDVRNVTEILEDGRYAMACVRARVAGEPLPQRRPPCFFNPQHGPSVRDVSWTPSGGTTRDVPACALDAERVEAGADPDSRRVMVGGQRRPYWEAGPAFAPFAAGYFALSGILPMMMMGTMMGSMFAADGSYAEGYQDGLGEGGGGEYGDGGGGEYGDGGGYDGGGGFEGGGGGDGGGFDFGGDWGF